MRCDNCKFHDGEPASMDYPYPIEFCAKGHWAGADPEDRQLEVDPWKDCPDHEPVSELFDGTRESLEKLTTVSAGQ